MTLATMMPESKGHLGPRHLNQESAKVAMVEAAILLITFSIIWSVAFPTHSVWEVLKLKQTKFPILSEREGAPPCQSTNLERKLCHWICSKFISWLGRIVFSTVSLFICGLVKKFAKKDLPPNAGYYKQIATSKRIGQYFANSLFTLWTLGVL